MDLKLKQEMAALHARICSALADPNRILILCMLGNGPKCVNDLAAALDISQSTVSRHLKILRERGLVFSERQGQFMEYKLADHRVISALELLRSVVVDMLREQVALAHTAKDSLLKAIEESAT